MMTGLNKLHNAIGLCLKAGMLYTGFVACEKIINDGKAVLILLDNKASGNTVKKVEALSKKNGVDILITEEMVIELATGRVNSKVAVVVDEGFKGMITKLTK